MIVPFDCQQCGKGVQAERNPDSGTAACPECGHQAGVLLALVPGVVLGNGYRIDKLLEESSSGDTYLGYQTVMARPVMVKILPLVMAQDDESFARFLRETKLTGSLRHPSIMGAVDAGSDSGIQFLVTNYKPGMTLREYLLQHGPVLDEKKALGLVMPIADALRHAWVERKILHRNVKPDNIYVTESGESLLMNLGIAKSLEDDSVNLTGVGYTVGTPEYMSPEQIQGEEDIDFRADLYSLGVVLYRCVVGELPFTDANPVALMTKQIEEEPVAADERNPNVSLRCSGLIDKMLKKDKSQRHGSWQELVDEMRAIAAGTSSKPAVVAPAAQKVKRERMSSNKMAARAAAAGAAARSGRRHPRGAGAAAAKSSGARKFVLVVVAAVVVLVVVAALIILSNR